MNSSPAEAQEKINAMRSDMKSDYHSDNTKLRMAAIERMNEWQVVVNAHKQ
jgi:uncharacterized protein YrzB (UPF0473 family)